MQSLLFYILAQLPPEGQEPGKIDLRSFLWVALVVALALFMLIITRQRMSRSKKHSDMSVKERVDHLKGSSGIYDQINELMARLADLSRQINGQIDTRTAKLEQLLHDADKAINKLEKHTKNQVPWHQETDGEGENPSFEPHQREPQVVESQQVAPKEKIISPETRQILQLAEEGLSAVEIAGQLDRPVGEIELILALNRSKPHSG